MPLVEFSRDDCIKNHLNYQTKPQTPISQSHYQQQQQPQQQQDIPSKPATPSKQPI